MLNFCGFVDDCRRAQRRKRATLESLNQRKEDLMPILVVRVEIGLSVPTTQAHENQARSIAEDFTNDLDGVIIFSPSTSSKSLTVDFTIVVSTQQEVMDLIKQKFRSIDDYKESIIAICKTRPKAGVKNSTDRKFNFTDKQGQYLAFIYYYTKVVGYPPAEADIQRYFGVTGPAVHQMITKLHEEGLIGRIPGRARSVQVIPPRQELPDLE